MDEQTRPSAIVNSDLDPGMLVVEATFAELGTVMTQMADNERNTAAPADPAAAREFSLAITHLEDAITRFNKGTYRRRGIFAVTDAERTGP